MADATVDMFYIGNILYNGTQYQATSIDTEFSDSSIFTEAEEILRRSSEYSSKQWVNKLKTIRSNREFSDEEKLVINKFVSFGKDGKFAPIINAIANDKKLMHKLKNTARSAAALGDDKKVIERVYELLEEPDIQEEMARIYGAAKAGLEIPSHDDTWYYEDKSLKKDCEFIKSGYEAKFLKSKEYRDVLNTIEKKDSDNEGDFKIDGNGSMNPADRSVRDNEAIKNARKKYIEKIQKGDDSTNKSDGFADTERNDTTGVFRTFGINFSYGKKEGDVDGSRLHENYLVSPGVALESFLDLFNNGNLEMGTGGPMSSGISSCKGESDTCELKMYEYDPTGKFAPIGSSDTESEEGVTAAISKKVYIKKGELHSFSDVWIIDDKYTNCNQDIDACYKFYVEEVVNGGMQNGLHKCKYIYNGNDTIEVSAAGGLKKAKNATQNELDYAFKRSKYRNILIPLKTAENKGYIHLNEKVIKKIYGPKQQPTFKPTKQKRVDAGISSVTIDGPNGSKIKIGTIGWRLVKKKGTISTAFPKDVVTKFKQNKNPIQYRKYNSGRTNVWRDYVEYDHKAHSILDGIDDKGTKSCIFKTINDKDGKPHVFVRRNAYKLYRRLYKNTNMVGGSRVFVHTNYSGPLGGQAAGRTVLAQGPGANDGVFNSVESINSDWDSANSDAIACATVAAGIAAFVGAAKHSPNPASMAIWGILYAIGAFITVYYKCKLQGAQAIWRNAGHKLLHNQVIQIQRQTKVGDNPEYEELWIRGLAITTTVAGHSSDNYTVTDNDQGAMFEPPTAFKKFKFKYDNWYARYWNRTYLPLSMYAMERSRGINRGALKYESYISIIVLHREKRPKDKSKWGEVVDVASTLYTLYGAAVIILAGDDNQAAGAGVAAATIAGNLAVWGLETYIVNPGWGTIMSEAVDSTNWNPRLKKLVGVAATVAATVYGGGYSGINFSSWSGIIALLGAGIDITSKAYVAVYEGLTIEEQERFTEYMKEAAKRHKKEMEAMVDCDMALSLLGEEDITDECIRVLNIDTTDTEKQFKELEKDPVTIDTYVTFSDKLFDSMDKVNKKAEEKRNKDRVALAKITESNKDKEKKDGKGKLPTPTIQ